MKDFISKKGIYIVVAAIVIAIAAAISVAVSGGNAGVGMPFPLVGIAGEKTIFNIKIAKIPVVLIGDDCENVVEVLHYVPTSPYHPLLVPCVM